MAESGLFATEELLESLERLVGDGIYVGSVCVFEPALYIRQGSPDHRSGRTVLRQAVIKYVTSVTSMILLVSKPVLILPVIESVQHGLLTACLCTVRPTEQRRICIVFPRAHDLTL